MVTSRVTTPDALFWCHSSLPSNLIWNMRVRRLHKQPSPAPDYQPESAVVSGVSLDYIICINDVLRERRYV